MAAAGAAVALACGPGVAGAQEGGEPQSYPYVSGELSIELHGDWTRDEDDVENREASTTIEPLVRLHFTPELQVYAGFTLEPVKDAEPGEDRAFEDHGLYVSDLVVDYDNGTFGLFGGKFTPAFGIGWDVTPGLYGTDMAEDYELSERIGFGGAVHVGNPAWGVHTLSAAAFFADTTGMSDSAFTRRGRTRLEDGGPSNTEDLSSFAIALDGADWEAAPGLHYHLAFERQAVDRLNDDTGAARPSDEIDDETGFAAALEYAVEVAPDVTVTPLVEWVRLADAGGERGIDQDYLTGAVALAWGPWNTALAATGRWTDNPIDPDTEDYQVQLSAGYTFESGVGVDVGVKRAEAEDVQSWTAGAMVSYLYEF